MDVGLQTKGTQAGISQYTHPDTSKIQGTANYHGPARNEKIKPHLNAFDVAISKEGLEALLSAELSVPETEHSTLEAQPDNPFMTAQANDRYRRIMGYSEL
jgi:hypothetical protein